MGDVSLSTVRGQPRRKIVTLTASNAALAIPSWAQGGKGAMRVSGTAAGGGQSALTGSQTGAGGGSGAWCDDYLIPIPSGITTLSVQIGASSTSAPGGSTILSYGSKEVLVLGGGSLGGPFASPYSYGGSTFGNTSETPPDAAGRISPGWQSGPSTKFSKSAPADGVGAGNPFGVSPILSSTTSEVGVGYGWGASGKVSVGPRAAMAGGDGILIIEFVEGF